MNIEIKKLLIKLKGHKILLTIHLWKPLLNTEIIKKIVWKFVKTININQTLRNGPSLTKLIFGLKMPEKEMDYERRGLYSINKKNREPKD